MRLWYRDGSFHDFTDRAGFLAAPPLKAAALVLPHTVTGVTYLNSGAYTQPRYFLWWPGRLEPYKADFLGLWDYLVEQGALSDTDAVGTISSNTITNAGAKIAPPIPPSVWHTLYSSILTDPQWP